MLLSLQEWGTGNLYLLAGQHRWRAIAVMGFAQAFGLTQDSQLDSDESHKFIEKTGPRCQATSHFGTGLYVDLWVNNAGVMGKNCIRDGKFFNSYISQHLSQFHQFPVNIYL